MKCAASASNVSCYQTAQKLSLPESWVSN